MFSRRRFVPATLLAAAVAVAGCHNAPRETGPLARRVGVYRFSERIRPPNDIASEVVNLEGGFVVLVDSVTVETTTGVCHVNTGISRANLISYNCGDVTIAFDRSNPVEGATYTATIKYTAYQQVCLRYTTDSQGRQVCAQTNTEAVQRQQIEHGRIRAMRASAGGP